MEESHHYSSWCSPGMMAHHHVSNRLKLETPAPSSESVSVLLGVFSELVAAGPEFAQRLEGMKVNEDELKALRGLGDVEEFQRRQFDGFLIDRLILRVISSLPHGVKSSSNYKMPQHFKKWLSWIQFESFVSLGFVRGNILNLAVVNAKFFPKCAEKRVGGWCNLMEAYREYMERIEVTMESRIRNLMYAWEFDRKKYRTQVMNPTIPSEWEYYWNLFHLKPECREAVKKVLDREKDFWTKMELRDIKSGPSDTDNQITDLLKRQTIILGISRQLMNLTVCFIIRYCQGDGHNVDPVYRDRLQTLKKIIVDRLSEDVVYTKLIDVAKQLYKLVKWDDNDLKI